MHTFFRMTSSIPSGINGLQYFFKNFSEDITLSVETMREIVALEEKKIEDLKPFDWTTSSRPPLDNMANAIMPDDFEENEFAAFQTNGDGNCLFRSSSILITGTCNSL